MAAPTAQTRNWSATSGERRARELRRLGYRVFRVHNIDVYENLEGVLDALLDFIEDPAG